MDPNSKLCFEKGELLSDSTHYRQLIGRLLYLTISRPDICFVVHKLSQFVVKPRVPHLQAVHMLLRYIKGSSAQEVFLSTSTSFQLKGFSDEIVLLVQT